MSSEKVARRHAAPRRRRFFEAAADMPALVGHTPLVALPDRLTGGRHVLVKHEGLNPGGSFRDRMARDIIEGALETGALSPGGEVVVAGGDNVAVSAALIAHSRGLSTTVFHPKKTERRLLKLLMEAGARLKWTPTGEGIAGAEAAARAYAAESGERLLLDGREAGAVSRAIDAILDELVEDLGGLRLGAFVTSVASRAFLARVAAAIRARFEGALVLGVILHSDEGPLGARVMPAGAEVLDIPPLSAWRARAHISAGSGLMLGPRGASATLGAMRLRPRVAPEDAIVALSIDGGQRYLGWEPDALDAQPDDLPPLW